MKWYLWIIILVVVIVVIVLVVRNNKAKQAALNQIAANTANQEPFNPFVLSQITKTT